MQCACIEVLLTVYLLHMYDYGHSQPGALRNYAILLVYYTFPSHMACGILSVNNTYIISKHISYCAPTNVSVSYTRNIG